MSAASLTAQTQPVAEPAVEGAKAQSQNAKSRANHAITQSAKRTGPIEIIQVFQDPSLTPKPRRADRMEPKAAAVKEAPERRRALALSTWLREGGDPARRPRRDVAMESAVADGLTARQGELQREARAPEQKPSPTTVLREKSGDGTGCWDVELRPFAEAPTTDAPLGLPPEARPSLSDADKLALRISMLGNEIVEQSHGPTRRWAILDRDGRPIDTPSHAAVAELISRGALALAGFVAGGAVWRLTDADASRRMALRR